MRPVLPLLGLLAFALIAAPSHALVPAGEPCPAFSGAVWKKTAPKTAGTNGVDGLYPLAGITWNMRVEPRPGQDVAAECQAALKLAIAATALATRAHTVSGPDGTTCEFFKPIFDFDHGNGRCRMPDGLAAGFAPLHERPKSRRCGRRNGAVSRGGHDYVLMQYGGSCSAVRRLFGTLVSRSRTIARGPKRIVTVRAAGAQRGHRWVCRMAGGEPRDAVIAGCVDTIKLADGATARTGVEVTWYSAPRTE